MILTGGTLLVCFCFPAVQDAEKGAHSWKVTDESSLLLSTRREDYCAVIHSLLLTEGTDLYCKNIFFGNMSSVIKMDVWSTTGRCLIILYFSCSITIADSRCRCLKVPTVCLAYLCLGHRMRLSSFVNSILSSVHAQHELIYIWHYLRKTETEYQNFLKKKNSSKL